MVLRYSPPSMMPSAPSLARKHPMAGYPSGATSGADIKSANKLSFSIDSLVGAAKCAVASSAIAIEATSASASQSAGLASLGLGVHQRHQTTTPSSASNNDPDSRPSSANGLSLSRATPSPSSPPLSQTLLTKYHQQAMAMARANAAADSPPPPTGAPGSQQHGHHRRPPHDLSPPVSQHHPQHHPHPHALHGALFGPQRNAGMPGVGMPGVGQGHPFAPHLGFLNGAGRSPFADYQSAAFYPWLLARQSPLGHMHGEYSTAITKLITTN